MARIPLRTSLQGALFSVWTIHTGCLFLICPKATDLFAEAGGGGGSSERKPVFCPLIKTPAVRRRGRFCCYGLHSPHRFLERQEDPREEAVMEHVEAEGTLLHAVSCA